MDLFAYNQISNLDHIAKINGIEIPRLHGYRYMLDEHKEDIDKYIDSIRDEVTNNAIEDACTSIVPFDPDSGMYTYGRESKERKLKYIEYEDGYEYRSNHIVRIKWEEFDPKDASKIKSYIEDSLLRYRAQMEMFNKYVGRADVLYVHARIGSGNWLAYEGDKIAQQPWFLEKIDDAFDETYCDIYCKLKMPGVDENA